MCYPKFQATHTSSYKKNKQIGTISPSGTKRGDCLISQYLQNHVTFEGVKGRHPKKNRGHFKKIVCFSQFFLLKSHHCLHTNLTQNNCHLIRKQKNTIICQRLNFEHKSYSRFIEIPWIFKKVAFQVARFFHFYQFKALGICFLFMWTAISFAPCRLRNIT